MPEVEYIVLSRWFDWLVANEDCHCDLIGELADSFNTTAHAHQPSTACAYQPSTTHSDQPATAHAHQPPAAHAPDSMKQHLFI